MSYYPGYPDQSLVGENWLRNRDIRREHRERRRTSGLLSPAQLHNERSELAETRPRDRFGRFLPEPNAPYHRKRRGPPPLPPDQLIEERRESAEERPRDEFGRFLPYDSNSSGGGGIVTRRTSYIPENAGGPGNFLIVGGAAAGYGGDGFTRRRRRRRSRSRSGMNLTPSQLSNERSILAELRPRNQYGQFVPETDAQRDYTYNQAIRELNSGGGNRSSVDDYYGECTADACIPTRRSRSGRRSRRRSRSRGRYAALTYNDNSSYYNTPSLGMEIDYGRDASMLPTAQAC